MRACKQIRAGSTALMLLATSWLAPISSVRSQGPSPAPSQLKQDYANPLANEGKLPASLGVWQPAQLASLRRYSSHATGDTRIIFQSAQSGNWEIFSADGNGSSLTQLTNSSAADIRPKLSHNGQRIVFASNRDGNFEIYTMHWNGSALTRLTNSPATDSTPVWSPDGSRIAFVSDRDGNAEIYVMNADGSNQTRLTTDARSNFSPAWSLTNRLVWATATSSTEGVLEGYDMTTRSAIAPFYGPAPYLNHPAWSSDGSRLMFEADVNGDYFADLFVEGLSPLLASPGALSDFESGSWSPDGEWVLFTKVSYVRVNGQLQVASLQVQRAPSTPASPPQPEDFLAGGPIAAPDWRWNDTLAPTANFVALPPYSIYSSSGIPIHWAGTDLGPAGVGSYTVEMKVDGGVWTTAAAEIRSRSIKVPLNSGQRALFRVVARDRAGNLQTAVPPERSTAVYRWRALSRWVDSRGHPIPFANVVLNPAAVNFPSEMTADNRGWHTAYMPETYGYQIHASHPGYGSLPSGHIIPSQSAYDSTDNALQTYLAPLDNVVADSSFEELTATVWLSTPVAPGQSQVKSVLSVSGSRSMHLSFGCNDPCLDVHSPAPGLYPYPVLAPGEDGVHVIYQSWGQTTSINHVRLQADNTWTSPEVIANTDAQYANVAAVADSSGNLHIAYRRGSGIYSRSQIQGVWQAESMLSDYESTYEMTADSAGNVHVALCCANGLRYRLRSAGAWQAPIVVDADSRTTPSQHSLQPRIVVAPNGVLHTLSVSYDASTQQDMLHYSRRAPGQSWTTETTPLGAFRVFAYAGSPNGNLHVVWARNKFDGVDFIPELSYSVREPSGGWSTREPGPELAVTASFQPAMAATDDGYLHLIYLGQYGNDFLLRRLSTGTWLPQYTLAGGQRSSTDHQPDLELDRQGVFHMMFNLGQYARDRRENVDQSVAVGQHMTISHALHRPTLSFMYRLQSIDANATRLRVTAQTDSGESVLLSFSEYTPDWQHAYADVSALVDKQLTITFKLEQKASSPIGNVVLDNVTLGSWLTPVITTTSIRELSVSAGPTEITVTGENFVPTPTVKLGMVVLSDVTYLGPSQLRCTIPAGFSLGTYDLLVTNPGGQQAVLAGAIQVGKRLDLPLVFR